MSVPAGTPVAAPTSAPSPTPADKVPLSQAIAYGAGGLCDFLYQNLPLAVATQIYAFGLKMDPALLGTAMAIAKTVSAAAGPVVGAMSDNCRSRFGRRRPFLLVGVAVGAVAMPLLWTPPSHHPYAMFAYVAVMLSLVSVFHTVYTIPYNALGLELSRDYDERTRVLAWRGYIQIIGVVSSAWFYWFTLRPVFGNELIGVRWLSVLVGAVMLASALWTILATHERVVLERQATLPLFPALKYTLTNRPFLILQLSVLVSSLALGCTGTLGLYVHVYYACQGDKDLSSVVSGLGGTLTLFSTFIGLPLGIWISRRAGKREAACVGIGLTLISIAILPWAITPANPYWVIIAWILGATGGQCAGLMYASMTADICDEDEVITHQRREGMFSAVTSLFNRFSQILMLLIAGWLPHLAGYVSTAELPTTAQLTSMKYMLIGTQFAGVAVGLGVLLYFPITRQRAADVRAQLESRRTANPQPAINESFNPVVN